MRLENNKKENQMKKEYNPAIYPKKNMLFNTRTNNVKLVEYGGMELIDYFAGQALIGYTSNQTAIEDINNMSAKGKGRIVDITAAHCYSYAKAMLKERQNHND